jgi:hypothetical protein
MYGMSALTDRVLSLRLPEETIRQQLLEIQQAVLANSRDIKDPNFDAIHPRDLRYLFTQYDVRFFDGLCAPALERGLKFKFSNRMTVRGGITKRIQEHSGEVHFEVVIASAMLFDGFREPGQGATVCGLECAHRLDALQRIFEHELLHLLEFLCWETSDCAKPRFQEISARIFLHRAHTHSLLTRRALAAKSEIVRGSLVSFPFQGRQLRGRVARISKRATVLVEDPAGPRYTDGKHYEKYSVPISALK